MWTILSAHWRQPLVALLLASLLAATARSASVLLMPLPLQPTHAFLSFKVGRELVQRGHQAVVLLAEEDVGTARSFGEQLESPGLELLTYRSNTTRAHFQALWRAQRFRPSFDSLLAGIDLWNGICSGLLADAPLMARLHALRPAVFVGDTVFLCTFRLGYALQRPMVALSATPLLDPTAPVRLANVPNPLAYVPQFGSGLPSPMGFVGRLLNVLTWVRCMAVEGLVVVPSLWRHGGAASLTQFFECRQLLCGMLYNTHFALDYPRPLPPGVRAVGPLLVQPPQPLPTDLQEFVDSAGEAGFVYASFGTICSVSAAELQAIAAALSTLPMRVLWKIKAEDLPEGLTFRDLRLGPNIKVVPTAPQNDVAAAPGLRAFLSHGGTGGVHEAAYNGVPLVGLPMIGDHFDNVMKAVHRGFGLLLDGRNVTKESVLAALTRVLDDRSFKQAAERVSRRMRSHTRSGVQQAADFIEHVVDTGGEPYLATPELPFYALYNLDVVLALAAACAALHFGVSMPLLRMVMAALRKMRGSAAVVLADGQNAMPPIASKSKRA